MAFVTSTVSVTTAATLLVTPTNGNVTDPVPVVIFNNDATNTVYLGGSGVATTNGMPILKQTGITLRLMAGDTLYGIAGATIDVRVMIGRQ